MNAANSQNQNLGFAVLIVAISYIKDGLEIVVPQNTTIFVDAESELALIGLDHVCVSEDEYRLV